MENKNKHIGYSDYWMTDKFDISGYDTFNVDSKDPLYYKLASLKRAISHFVRILTKKSIPVIYSSEDVSYTDGMSIVLSGVINEGEIDSTVGLALHEASHVVLTDFEFYHKLPKIIMSDKKYRKTAIKRNISSTPLIKFTIDMTNFIEDRRIDRYQYDRKPGLREYYLANYKRYFYSDIIKETLESLAFRSENLESYLFRTTSLLHPSRDLNAIKGLNRIYDILDLENIDRLTSIKDSYSIAKEIMIEIFRNIEPIQFDNSDMSGDSIFPMEKIESDEMSDIQGNNSIPNNSNLETELKNEKEELKNEEGEDLDNDVNGVDGNEIDMEDEKEPNSDQDSELDNGDKDNQETNGNSGSKDDSKDQSDNDSSNELLNSNDVESSNSDEDGDNMSSKNSETNNDMDDKEESLNKNDEDINERTDDKNDTNLDESLDGDPHDTRVENDLYNESMTESRKKDLKVALDKLFDYLSNDVEKKSIPKHLKELVDNLVTSELSIEDVNIYRDINISTKQSDNPLQVYYNEKYRYQKVPVCVIKNIKFNLDSSKVYSFIYEKSLYEENVKKGIQMGKIIGRKLQIRNDEKIITTIRKKSGYIDRRLLYEHGFQNDSIFKRSKKIEYTKAIVHISIDNSGSMSGNKLGNCIQMATSIAMAANVIENLDVVVSLRSTDPFNYVSSIEGEKTEVYIAIIYDSRVDPFIKVKKLFPHLSTTGITPEGLSFSAIRDEIESSNSKLNSYFINLSDGLPNFLYYGGDLALYHTKSIVNSFVKRGINVLSYYIDDEDEGHMNREFQIMYGKYGKVINPNSITGITKTLNKLFLKK